VIASQVDVPDIQTQGTDEEVIMGQNIDFGVFLPVTNNGWVISKTSPQFLPSYEHLKPITQLAEKSDFSYVFSMAKWRGFGGEVEFWKYSLESMILMTGLLHAAPSLQMIASVAPALMHPAVFAKMAATMDDIAAGRMGINIVSAGNKGEYTQMCMYPENFEDYRYEYNDEWISIAKRLWSEASTTYKGRFFELDDCISYPKPAGGSIPISCATSSERGFQFVAQHCTDGLFGGLNLDQQIFMSRRMKEVAASYNRKVRTHTLMLLIQGDSDDDAERILRHYENGADKEAIENIYRLRSRGKVDTRLDNYKNRFETSDTRLFYAGVPFVGGPERVADRLESLAIDGDLDGFLFILPDFLPGIERFSQQVMPILRKRGFGRLTQPFQAQNAAAAE
jgi:pyrimidine oxygenase